MIVGTGRLYQTFEMSNDKTTKYPGVDGVTVPSLQEVRRTCKFENKATVHVMVFVYVCGRKHQPVECKTRNGWGTTTLTTPSSNITSFMKPKKDPNIPVDTTHPVCDNVSAASSSHVSDTPLTSSATPAALADSSVPGDDVHVGAPLDEPDTHAIQPVVENVTDQYSLHNTETEILQPTPSCDAHDVSGSTQSMGADTDVASPGLLIKESVDSGPANVDNTVCPDVTASETIPPPTQLTASGSDHAHASSVGRASCTTYLSSTPYIPLQFMHA